MYSSIVFKLQKQIRKVFDFKKIYEVPITTLQNLTPDNQIELTFKFVNIEDILAFDFLALEYDNSSISLSKEWLAEEKMMLVGYYKSQPVIYGWISKEELDLSLGEVRKIPPQTLYVFKIFIHKQYRGKNLLSHYYQYLGNYFVADNKNILIWIANSNIPSIKSHLKLGFHAIESYVTIRLGSKFLSFFLDKTITHFKK